jgi:hypothetical protein
MAPTDTAGGNAQTIFQIRNRTAHYRIDDRFSFKNVYQWQEIAEKRVTQRYCFGSPEAFAQVSAERPNVRREVMENRSIGAAEELATCREHADIAIPLVHSSAPTVERFRRFKERNVRWKWKRLRDHFVSSAAL